MTQTVLINGTLPSKVATNITVVNGKVVSTVNASTDIATTTFWFERLGEGKQFNKVNSTINGTINGTAASTTLWNDNGLFRMPGETGRQVMMGQHQHYNPTNDESPKSSTSRFGKLSTVALILCPSIAVVALTVE